MEIPNNVPGIEVAADGQRVNAAEIRRRGLVAVGRKLQAERAEDDRLGRGHRKLNMTEQRALNAAQGEQ